MQNTTILPNNTISTSINPEKNNWKILLNPIKQPTKLIYRKLKKEQLITLIQRALHENLEKTWLNLKALPIERELVRKKTTEKPKRSRLSPLP